MRFARRPEAWLVACGGLHRLLIFMILRNPLAGLVMQAPPGLTMQFLPLPVLTAHFWAGLLVLRQSPPLPMAVLKLVTLVTADPVRMAALLVLLNGALSILSCVLVFRMIGRVFGAPRVGFVLAAWLLFSTDLLLIEYGFFGQQVYELLAMLGIAAGTLAYARLCQAPSCRRALALGAIAACCALTRSSLSYLPLVVLVCVGLRCGGRALLACALPVLLLQGGWALKNEAVFGMATWETSDWGGLNAAKSVWWSGQSQALCEDILAAPAGRFTPAFVTAARLCRPPFAQAYAVEAARESAAGARRDPLQPVWNTDGVAAESAQWKRAVLHFTLARPDLMARRFGLLYRLVWARIADSGALFPANLIRVEPRDAGIFDLAAHGFQERQRLSPGGSDRQPAAAGAKLHLPAISLAPLDGLTIWSVHLGLPLLLLWHGWRRVARGARWRRPGTLFLAIEAAYCLAVFTFGEGGENMRFRVAVEPALLALTGLVVAEAVQIAGFAGLAARASGWRVRR